ncbi:serine/arginine repetitive matrix protein 1-like [Penaeus indicus]|uniref:serine/arginine repetitive matrix protein 1-like n=1 Tax=Penaeus indicus TaxID=29960 RepID=UPI00300D0605
MRRPHDHPSDAWLRLPRVFPHYCLSQDPRERLPVSPSRHGPPRKSLSLRRREILPRVLFTAPTACCGRRGALRPPPTPQPSPPPPSPPRPQPPPPSRKTTQTPRDARARAPPRAASAPPRPPRAAPVRTRALRAPPPPQSPTR